MGPKAHISYLKIAKVRCTNREARSIPNQHPTTTPVARAHGRHTLTANVRRLETSHIFLPCGFRVPKGWLAGRVLDLLPSFCRLRYGRHPTAYKYPKVALTGIPTTARRQLLQSPSQKSNNEMARGDSWKSFLLRFACFRSNFFT